MNKFNRIKSYINYKLNAQGLQKTHSPFVYKFIKEVINGVAIHPEIKQIEKIRRQLLKDSKVIEFQDYGAGSMKSPSKKSEHPTTSLKKN